ncbi:MAG: hypothetical protein EOO45_03655 [Flavobacterium sp.]|nr:MAG: hypothetical protein EOO45_03655 [Flavobacterium sp.]
MGNVVKKLFFAVAGLSLVIIVSSCSITRKHKTAVKVLTTDYCDQKLQDEQQPSYHSADSLSMVATLLAGTLSEEEIKLANALGILNLLREQFTLKQKKVNTERINYLSLETQNRIIYATGIVDGLAATIHCESERCGRLSDYLDGISKKRVNKLTIGAILGGTISGLAPLIVKNQGTQNALVISGSAISAGLGILALTNAGKTVEFTYDKNFLADVWYNPNSSTVYPKFVWLMLKAPRSGSLDPQTSVAAGLRKRWLMLEFNNSLDDHLKELLFGDARFFKEDELLTRQVLLNQLSTEIRLLNNYLIKFSQKLKAYQ